MEATKRNSESDGGGADEKKLCSACKMQRPRRCFSKRQWFGEESEGPRRCSDCIQAKRGDPHKLKKLAIQQEKLAMKREEKRKLWSLPDESQMDRRCSGCGKWEGEGDKVAAAVTFIACPFCAQATYPSQRTNFVFVSTTTLVMRLPSEIILTRKYLHVVSTFLIFPF